MDCVCVCVISVAGNTVALLHLLNSLSVVSIMVSCLIYVPVSGFPVSFLHFEIFLINLTLQFCRHHTFVSVAAEVKKNKKQNKLLNACRLDVYTCSLGYTCYLVNFLQGTF